MLGYKSSHLLARLQKLHLIKVRQNSTERKLNNMSKPIGTCIGLSYINLRCFLVHSVRLETHMMITSLCISKFSENGLVSVISLLSNMLALTLQSGCFREFLWLSFNYHFSISF